MKILNINYTVYEYTNKCLNEWSCCSRIEALEMWFWRRSLKIVYDLAKNNAERRSSTVGYLLQHSSWLIVILVGLMRGDQDQGEKCETTRKEEQIIKIVILGWKKLQVHQPPGWGETKAKENVERSVFGGDVINVHACTHAAEQSEIVICRIKSLNTMAILPANSLVTDFWRGWESMCPDKTLALIKPDCKRLHTVSCTVNHIHSRYSTICESFLASPVVSLKSSIRLCSLLFNIV